MSTSTQRKGKGIYINNWTITEDDVLIESLKELYEDNVWRVYGGLKDGYLAQLQTMMKFKLPGWKVKSCPDIQGRVNFLKKKYFAITDMITEGGFDWNENQMMIVGDKSFYNEWVKFHKKAKGLYCEPFLHYYSLQEIYGKDSVTGDKGKLKQEDASDEHLNADVEMRSNCDFLMDLNANRGVKSKTEVSVPDQQEQPRIEKRKFRENSPVAPNCGLQVGESICMEEMSEKYGSMASSVTATRLKIDDLGLKVDSLGLKIDGVVNALSQSREVADLQAKLVNELNKIEGLNDTHIFRAINILAPRHDLLRVFFTMAEEMKKSYILDLLIHGL